MKRAWQWVGSTLSLTLLVASWGCSEKPSVDTTNAEAKVTGKVTIRGKAMNGGEITFDPANYLRADVPSRSSKIKEDGTFELTTLQGRNSVLIKGPAITKEPQLGYAALVFEIKPGDNPIDIKLPPE
jgi:hypothetical protein